MMTNRQAWRDAAERVVAVFAGGMVAVVGVAGADLTDGRVWLGGALAGALEVLRAVASRTVGERNSNSLTR